MRPEDQQRVVLEVVARVVQAHARKPEEIENLLLDTFYEERNRLESEKDHKAVHREVKFYREMQSLALRGGIELRREVFQKVTQHFTEEVLGHFNETIFKIATQVVPVGLNLLLNTISPLRLIQRFPKGLVNLDNHILIQGSFETFQKIAKLGTTILVPTHCSNLDSLLIGYVLYRLGLPPFLYGAGLNLFRSKTIGFFMDHLGAYKVDRKKKALLYKEVLKTYAGYSLELGYHNLFFSGGTRSRSGAVESKLKLGLLGTGIDAYLHNLIQKKKNPDIFVVPCTLNYQLIIEAETLIEDYLKTKGKSQFVIEDEEFSKVERILEFLRHLFSLDSKIHVVFSNPLDVFGNQIDAKGNSLDHRGRIVDRHRYLLKNGEYCFDVQRDQEYTQELGRVIVASFHNDIVVNSVQLISRVVFDWLTVTNPQLDLYHLLRTGGAQESMPLKEAYEKLSTLLKKLQGLAKKSKIRLDSKLYGSDPVAILSEALAHLKSYHGPKVLERKGDRLFHYNRNLLFYYQNRLPITESLL